jgi:hypothetical protein
LLATKYILKEAVTSFRQLQSFSTGVRIQTDRNPSVQASPMQMNSDQLLCRLYIFGGIAAIAGPLCAAGFYPQFPLWLVPAGDDWPIVALRILLLTTAIGVCYWWFELGKNKRSSLFRGKLSDGTSDELAVAERQKPDSPKDAAVRNWELLVVAAFAFLVAAWLLYFNNPGPVLEAGPRRLRGAVKILQWCRGNPNTVVSSAVLVGCFTCGLYAYRVARASIDSNSTHGLGRQ